MFFSAALDDGTETGLSKSALAQLLAKVAEVRMSSVNAAGITQVSKTLLQYSDNGLFGFTFKQVLDGV